jgi:hypothetical protein
MTNDPQTPQPLTAPVAPQLRKGALGLREALAVSLEAMGPLLGALVGVPLVITLAGAGAPLVLIVGLVSMLCVAHVIGAMIAIGHRRAARQGQAAAS